jgi:hypothetical protein
MEVVRDQREKVQQVIIFYSFMKFTCTEEHCSRSQWSRGLRHEPVFGRWNTGIVGSYHALGLDVCVCLFCVCIVLCVGSGLATGWSPNQGVLPSVKIKYAKRRRSQGSTKGCRAIDEWIHWQRIVGSVLVKIVFIFWIPIMTPKVGILTKTGENVPCLAGKLWYPSETLS